MARPLVRKSRAMPFLGAEYAPSARSAPFRTTIPPRFPWTHSHAYTSIALTWIPVLARSRIKPRNHSERADATIQSIHSGIQNLGPDREERSPPGMESVPVDVFEPLIVLTASSRRGRSRP